MLTSIIATAGAALLSLLVTLFVVEVISAIAFRSHRTMPVSIAVRPKIAVVVPAHNEGANLIPTLLDLKAQLQPADRLIVVADNCSDDTSVTAAKYGAEVLERNDPSKHGKGYALAWAIQNFESNPPEFVLFFDADCAVASDAVDELLMACVNSLHPTQALYLMGAPKNAEINYQVAELAWVVKNWIRPLGLSALGLPCQLMGTGMAFPWEIIRSANLATGDIVEDLKLGLDLAAAGSAPRFCPSARVNSTFASSDSGNRDQRQRWEKGHVSTILASAPGLLFHAVRRRNLDLLVLVLDLMIPPLSLFGLLLVLCFTLTGLVAICGGSAIGLVLSTFNLIAFATASTMLWMRFGREILPVHAIPRIASYVAEKLPLYNRILTGNSATKWTRTDRSPPAKVDPVV